MFFQGLGTSSVVELFIPEERQRFFGEVHLPKAMPRSFLLILRSFYNVWYMWEREIGALW